MINLTFPRSCLKQYCYVAVTKIGKKRLVFLEDTDTRISFRQWIDIPATVNIKLIWNNAKSYCTRSFNDKVARVELRGNQLKLEKVYETF